MKKLIFITSFAIVFLVFIAPAMLTFGIRFIPNDIQPSLEKTRGLFWEFEISQDFISTKENLTAIGMSIRNPNLKNKKDINLFLYDKEGELLRTSVLSGKNIGDGSFVRFGLEVIPDSKDKQYKFVLSAPDARGEDRLEIFYTNDKPFWIGDSEFDKEVVEGGVSFVTLHKPISRIGLIKEIYSGWLDRLLEDRAFSIVYILILTFLVGYLLHSQTRKKGGN